MIQNYRSHQFRYWDPAGGFKFPAVSGAVYLKAYADLRPLVVALVVALAALAAFALAARTDASA